MKCIYADKLKFPRLAKPSKIFERKFSKKTFEKVHLFKADQKLTSLFLNPRFVLKSLNFNENEIF